MNPTARKLTALSLAAVMGLGLAACSGGSGNGDATGTASPTPGTTAEPTSYADQIVVGITAEPKYIEPNAPGMGPAEVQVSQQIFEGLVRTGDDGSIEPVLATDWTISDDGLTYTFNLVQGVKFSNGEDVEPSDWVWSFYRARDYETSNYRYIAEAIDTVEATDEQVVITLTEPNAAFLAELGCFNMVLGDQSYAESMSDEEYLKNPVGTGPYMLKDWTQGSSLTLEANPYYRVEGMPKTKEIKYVLIADDNTRLMQLQSGQIDVAPTFPFSLAQGVESNEALALDIFPSTQIYYLTVNTTKPPFDDVKVRQALYYALNKSELASAIAGEYGTPVAALTEKLGLNEPLLTQYLLFLKQIFTLDFGNSFTYQMPVSELLASRFPVTLALTLMSTVISLVISLPLGYFAGVHKDRLGDQVVRTTSLVAISMPSFWVGLLLMIVFALKLKWLPAGGWSDTLLGQFRCLILPAVTQSLMTSALLLRNTRNSVVDITRMDYVDFARSKGITSGEVRTRHVMRNAMISTVTLLSMRMAAMLGGSVIIETVFSVPGIGKLASDAIFGRDYAVVQYVVLLFAVLVLVINLITDILYSFLDPRVNL